MIKVLIVDDEVQLLRNVARYLGTFDGLEVLTATSGEDGVSLVQQYPVDVLLTDVRLPGIDGIEVVRRTLSLRPSSKVIVMTAFGSGELKKEALRGGALRFLEKPLDLDEVRRLVQELGASYTGWSGSVSDLDIFDLTQLLLLARRRRVVRITAGQRSGVLAFEEDGLRHASTADLTGAEAFCEMLSWDGGTFEDLPDNGGDTFPVNVAMPSTQLMMEAARLRDERRERQQGQEEEPAADLSLEIARLVAPFEFPCDVCVLGREGTPVAERYGLSGSPDGLAELCVFLHYLASHHPRSGLRQILLTDSIGKVVLTPLPDQRQLVIGTDKAVPSGALLRRANQVAVDLGQEQDR